MSDLRSFRDHAAAMAQAEHFPTCPSLTTPPQRPVWDINYDHEGRPASLSLAGFTAERPTCDGCYPAEHRALWERLAAEVDDYLEPVPDLFGGESVEPRAKP